MITVELTEDHLAILTQGALRYGRIAIGVKSTDGDDDVILVYAQTHRRGRPVKPRAPAVDFANAPSPNGPAGEPQ